MLDHSHGKLDYVLCLWGTMVIKALRCAYFRERRDASHSSKHKYLSFDEKRNGSMAQACNVIFLMQILQ